MYYRPVRRQIPRTSQIAPFASPTAGWTSNQNIASPPPGLPGAIVLDNIFPTAQGGVIRRGSDIYAQLGLGDEPVTALFTYNFGNNKKFFGSTASTVYDITVIISAQNYTLGTENGDEIVTDLGDFIGESSTQGLEVLENMTGGNWIDEQFATTGGNYLIIVNGSDPMQLYDGSDWYAITDEPINRINYDTGTAAFTVGATITGGTSGATATITRVVGDTTSGYILVGTITGTFQDNEIISGGGGSASVNGVVGPPLFNGITGTLPDGSPLETSMFSYVWTYKNRLFFLQKDSMDAWYLPVDQIGGTAKLFPMGSEFSLGGKLLFGSTWSRDTGIGLKDTCIFVTDEGEISVYDGSDPDVALEWQKVGRYQMGKPRGPRSFFRAGGDLVVATDIGLVPMSQALQVDYSVLSAKAVSFPIETAWNEAVSLRQSNWDCIVWPERQMVVICLPTVNEQTPEMWVVNARTGAWGRFTNWDGTCLEIFNGRLFFGSQEGKVVEAYVTGLDQGKTYTASWVPLFSDLGSPASIKTAKIARAVTRGPHTIDAQLSVQEDYIVTLPPAPPSTAIQGGSEWGVGLWGQATWGGQSDIKIQQSWNSVGGRAYAFAPSLQVTSGSLVPLDTELIRLELVYEAAEIVT